MNDAKIEYNQRWVENELKWITPSEYMKRYAHLWSQHTWGATAFLLWKLMEQMADMIEELKNERR